MVAQLIKSPVEPDIQAIVHPSSVRVLDVSPYNSFSLTCTAVVGPHEEVQATPTLSWTRDGVGIGSGVVHTDMPGAVLVGVLTAVEEEGAGEYLYSCVVRLALQYEDDDLTGVDTSVVRVEG